MEILSVLLSSGGRLPRQNLFWSVQATQLSHSPVPAARLPTRAQHKYHIQSSLDNSGIILS